MGSMTLEGIGTELSRCRRLPPGGTDRLPLDIPRGRSLLYTGPALNDRDQSLLPTVT